MNRVFSCAALVCGLGFSALAAPKAANTSSRHAQALHFARGATNLSVRGTLNGNRRFYTLKMNAGQHLKISAAGQQKVVPLIFVTPPCGKFNGDKTATYSEDSSRAGTYKIEVGTNLMASEAARGRIYFESFGLLVAPLNR